MCFDHTPSQTRYVTVMILCFRSFDRSDFDNGLEYGYFREGNGLEVHYAIHTTSFRFENMFSETSFYDSH